MLVRNTKLQVGSDHVASNFEVCDIRYDLILGMPKNKNSSILSITKNGQVIVNGNSLTREEHINSKVQVSNLGVKKFFSLLRKSHEKFDL